MLSGGIKIPVSWIWVKEETQLTFTCPKSTIERLEKGVKYVQR